MNVTCKQLTDLARPLVDVIKNFYEESKNEEEYQKWLLCVEKHEELTETD